MQRFLDDPDLFLLISFHILEHIIAKTTPIFAHQQTISITGSSVHIQVRCNYVQPIEKTEESAQIGIRLSRHWKTTKEVRLVVN
jgi:hypothetical protein